MRKIVCKTLLCWLIFTTISCTGGGPSRDDDDDEPERSGEKFDLEKVEYFDANPDISAAGTRVVFISGREKSLKSFKYEKSDDEATPATASRVSDDDYGEEIEVAISPDGTKIAFIGNKDEVLDIYVTTFADGGTIHQIADDAAGIESHISFSADSNYLLFSKRNSGTNDRQAYVVTVAANGTPGTSVAVSDDSQDEFDPIWVPQSVATNYRVATKIFDDTNFSYSILAHDFTTPVAPTHSTLLENTKIAVETPRFSASQAGIYFVTPNPITAGERLGSIRPIGNKKQSQKVQIVSFGQFLAASSTAPEKLETVGFDVLSYSANSSGTLGLFTVREAFLCEYYDDKSLRYRVSMVLYDLSAKQIISRVVPKTDPEETEVTWLRTDDPCDSEVKRGKNIDHDVIAAKLAANSTSTNFQLVYTTFYSTDSNKTDSEIRLLTSATAGEITTDNFHEVSNNKQP